MQGGRRRCAVAALHPFDRRSDMRDDKHLLQASKAFAQERRGTSWWHLASTCAAIAVLIFALCWPTPWPLRTLLSVVLGLVLVRMFIIYHDYLHGTILRQTPWLRPLMTCYGLLVLNPPRIWARSHNHHHRNTGRTYGASIGSFALMTQKGYHRAKRSARLSYAASRHPLTIAASYLTVFLLGMCVRSFLVDPRRHYDSAVSIVLHVGLLVGLYLIDPALLFYLALLPMTVGCALGGYLFYAQHNFPAAKVFAREDWTYVKAAIESSSYIRMGPLMRWFTGNIGYHHVHHLNARIPFYRLPEAMAGIVELQSPGATTLRPTDIRDCFRLKVWDTRRGALVGFGIPAGS